MLELDYASITSYLKQMNYPMDILVCQDRKIVLSNGKFAGTMKEFEEFTGKDSAG